MQNAWLPHIGICHGRRTIARSLQYVFE